MNCNVPVCVCLRVDTGRCQLPDLSAVVVMVAFEMYACVPVSKPVFLYKASSNFNCHCQGTFSCKKSSYECCKFGIV